MANIDPRDIEQAACDSHIDIGDEKGIDQWAGVGHGSFNSEREGPYLVYGRGVLAGHARCFICNLYCNRLSISSILRTPSRMVCKIPSGTWC